MNLFKFTVLGAAAPSMFEIRQYNTTAMRAQDAIGVKLVLPMTKRSEAEIRNF